MNYKWSSRNNRSTLIRHKRNGAFSVPKENIIDLKKLQYEKEKKQKIERQQSVIYKIKKFRLPKFKISLHKEIHPPKVVAEKVIVSKLKFKSTNKQVLEKQATQLQEPYTEKLDYRQFQLSVGWSKKLLSFALMCLIIILPVYAIDFYHKAKEARGKVLGISSEAYKLLQEAGSQAAASDFDLASQSFYKAADNFITARQQLESVGGVVLSAANIIPNKAKSAEYLLSAGNHLSQTGAILTTLINGLEEISINPLEQESETSLSDFLISFRDEIAPVGKHLSSAIEDLENVRIKDLPEEYQSGIGKVKETLPILMNNFNNLYDVSDVMLSVLGHQAPKRYLLIFQNNRELRPTGGFIGSIALIDIFKGKIKNLEVPGGGVYDVAGQLKEKIIAPKPLWLVNPHWNIQDSNWFIDFPTSAKKLIWFFERTGGATVDGIIALTPTVVEELIEIVGPINMEDYNIEIDRSNFIRQAQRWAEVEYDREENQPKKFIKDLLPILFNKLSQAETGSFLRILDVFNRSFTSKQFLLFFSDDMLQQKIRELNWDGSILQTDKDYLAVVSTNIAGGKTDHVVDQLVEHKASIDPDGFIINTVTITRTHQGNILDLWEKKVNVDYVRFYVPAGSVFLGADGFDNIPAFRYMLPDEDALPDKDLEKIEAGSIIDEQSGTRITSEFNKTVFGNWLSIEPGETQQAVIQYKLPFRLEVGGWLDETDVYSLLVQRQPGILNNYFTSTVELSDNYEIVWSQSGLNVSNNQVELVTDLDTDKYFGLLIR